jgi:excisionase family DNA binding protein
MTRKLTPVKAADILGVSTKRIYQLISSGRLKATRDSYGYLITCADLEAFAALPKINPALARQAKRKISSDNLTVDDAAKILGVSAGRVRQFISTGKLPAARDGVGYLIDKDKLDAFAKTPRKLGRPRKAPEA